jgi:hypothetical protein
MINVKRETVSLRAGIRSRVLSTILAAFAMTMLVFGSPSSASASAGDVQVSPDGSTYYTIYSGVLFTSVGLLVPGSSQQQTFYIRNSGTAPGYLRIVLRDVVFTDSSYAQALSLQLSSPGHSGAATAISSAAPCRVLLEGQTVGPGAVVVISAAVALGNLNGQVGQNTAAQFSLGVELIDTATGSLPPTSCGGGTLVHVTPPVAQNPNQSSTPTPKPPQLPVESDNSDPDTGDTLITPNTVRRYEEYLAVIPLGAYLAGLGVFFLISRRRERRDQEKWNFTHE